MCYVVRSVVLSVIHHFFFLPRGRGGEGVGEGFTYNLLIVLMILVLVLFQDYVKTNVTCVIA